MENNYQLSRIHNYVMGLMTREEMHVLENEALEDPFLQDAIDGYRLQNGVDVKQLSLLQRRLAERVEARSSEKAARFFTWQRLTVGTAAAVMFLVVCSLLLMNYFPRKGYKETEVVLMDSNFKVNLTVNSKFGNAEPLIGWTQFTEEMNSAIKDYPDLGNISVKFNINQSKATAIQVDGVNDRNLRQVLINFIENETSWAGNRAEIHLKIEKD